MRELQCKRAARSAFTLIELLVVIAIVVLLVSILLPALRRARLSSQNLVCQSNVRQIGLAVLLYAEDFDDRVWPVALDAGQGIPPKGAAWARLPTPTGGVKPGFLYDYVQQVEKIAECPTNQRAGKLGGSGRNMFGGRTELDFDYTMVANTQGARLDRSPRLGYLTQPQRYTMGALPPSPQPFGADIRLLDGLPVFVEENTRWYNATYTDGLWSNADQFETRHNRGANVVYLQGHVETFRPPMGTIDREREPADLDANDLYVRDDLRQRWVRLELRSGTMHPYGWINNPDPGT